MRKSLIKPHYLPPLLFLSLSFCHFEQINVFIVDIINCCTAVPRLLVGKHGEEEGEK